MPLEFHFDKRHESQCIWILIAFKLPIMISLTGRRGNQKKAGRIFAKYALMICTIAKKLWLVDKSPTARQANWRDHKSELRSATDWE